MNVVIMESLGIGSEELEKLQKPFVERGCRFSSYEKTADVERMIDQAKDADCMILANMPMPEAVLNACSQLKFVDIAFTGVDHVAMDVLHRRKIVVSNASGYATESVAELTLALALSLLRNIPQVEQRCRDGQTKAGLVGNELKGKTVGIVGLGKIGLRSAELFHAFGCKLVASSRSVHADCPSFIDQVGLDALLRSSDIVVLHCPLTASTKGLIDKDALAKMKRTAFLINVARGQVVVARDLYDALEAGQIAGSGLDVFDKEPPLTDEILLKARNTIVTPHVAFATAESMSLRAKMVFDNLQAFLDGKPVNLV